MGAGELVLNKTMTKSFGAYWENRNRFRRLGHPVVEKFAVQRLSFLLQLLSVRELGRILDVGCGNGISTFYFSKKTSLPVVGTDSSFSMLSGNPCRPLVCADAAHLPFRSNTFDLAYCWELLHHAVDPLLVVKEMKRVSKSYVVMVEPNGRNPLQQLFALFSESHRQVFKYSKSYLISLVKQSGMSIVCSETFGWIFPHKTPAWLLPVLQRFPFETRLGISNMVIGEK